MARAIRLVALLLVSAAIAQPDGGVQCSPFTGIRFADEHIAIRVGDAWYQWVALDGIEVDAIKDAAAEMRGGWQKRISEDLTYVLGLMGHEHGPTVTLRVRPVGGGEVRELVDVPMTHANRRAVWRSMQGQNLAVVGVPGAGAVDGAAAFRALAEVVDERHAYAHLRGVDVHELAARAQEWLGDDHDRGRVLLGAQRLICELGDGHAGVSGWMSAVPEGRLDFLLQHAEGGVVAYRRDPGVSEGVLLAEGYPFVVSMDGVPIERWIEAASVYVTAGSDALVRRRSTRLLRDANLVRDELGLERAPRVTVVLRSEAGERLTVAAPVAGRGAVYGVWLRLGESATERGFETRVLAGHVGYVRLASMIGDSGAAELREEVEGLASCRGLILDVRDNGGGSRAALRALLPLFMKEDARVVNIAARRVTGQGVMPRDGWLANRYAYPVDWDGWTAAERAAVAGAMGGFEPEWSPPADEFSGWHAMVVSRDAEARFEGPVVVLMNAGCFSATDIFLGGFKGLEGVTLVGTRSSGGSARSESHPIPEFGAVVRLASMASFQPDGRLYDTNGVEPDVVVPATIDGLLGRADSQLDAAIAEIDRRAPE